MSVEFGEIVFDKVKVLYDKDAYNKKMIFKNFFIREDAIIIYQYFKKLSKKNKISMIDGEEVFVHSPIKSYLSPSNFAVFDVEDRTGHYVLYIKDFIDHILSSYKGISFEYDGIVPVTIVNANRRRKEYDRCEIILDKNYKIMVNFIYK